MSNSVRYYASKSGDFVERGILLNDTEVTIQFSGSALSDAGDMSFDIEFSIDLTATLN